MEVKNNSAAVLFKNEQPILFSMLMEKRVGFALQWKAWKPRMIELLSDGVLIHRNEDSSVIRGKFRLQKVTLTLMSIPGTGDSSVGLETGVIVQCSTMDGFETFFRCIMPMKELEDFKVAIQSVANEYSVTNMKNKKQPKRFASYSGSRNETKTTKNQPVQSIMRGTIAQAMNHFDLRSNKERIISKRGALKFLPVAFSNDLVHGSWWFVIGSISFFVASAMVLGNSYEKDPPLGDDDSLLSREDYRATWVLMIISGIFSTLGSLAFVRAVHQDPPLKPLFHSWYHLQNDELLGSWLFLLATIPFIPYCFIFLSDAARSRNEAFLYLGALFFAVLLAIGSFLFVRACYPIEKSARKNILMPVLKCLCAGCCSRQWLRFHFQNDWLAGTWLFLWATFLATFACLVLLVLVLERNDSLMTFILATSLFENICFFIGSAYFVAGSYPEGPVMRILTNGGLQGVADGDIDEDTIDNEEVELFGFGCLNNHVNMKNQHDPEDIEKISENDGKSLNDSQEEIILNPAPVSMKQNGKYGQLRALSVDSEGGNDSFSRNPLLFTSQLEEQKESKSLL